MSVTAVKSLAEQRAAERLSNDILHYIYEEQQLSEDEIAAKLAMPGYVWAHMRSQLPWDLLQAIRIAEALDMRVTVEVDW